MFSGGVRGVVCTGARGATVPYPRGAHHPHQRHRLTTRWVRRPTPPLEVRELQGIGRRRSHPGRLHPECATTSRQLTQATCSSHPGWRDRCRLGNRLICQASLWARGSVAATAAAPVVVAVPPPVIVVTPVVVAVPTTPVVVAVTPVVVAVTPMAAVMTSVMRHYVHLLSSLVLSPGSYRRRRHSPIRPVMAQPGAAVKAGGTCSYQQTWGGADPLTLRKYLVVFVPWLR